MSKRTDDSEHIKPYDIREHKFMSMEKEKRDKVINAALMEFSKGYTAASTDTIVKEAGISKGLIFHYFGSKRGLFLFLIKYSLDIMINEYEKIISRKNDFLENLRIVSEMKSDMSFQNTLAFSFMVKAYSSLKDVFSDGLPTDLEDITNISLNEIWKMSNNDPRLFKRGININMAKNIIIWTINGFSEGLIRYGDDVEAYMAHHDELVREKEEYLQFLRKIFYK